MAYEKLSKAHRSRRGVLAATTICEIATTQLEPGQLLAKFLTHIHNLHNQLAQYATEDKEIALSLNLLAIFLLNMFVKEYDYITALFYADIVNLRVQAVLDQLVQP
ncbi:hypothetical protein CROQUDRAFT_132626 [Cronartium quercuum f. sp. fusiforme G11]|uniref:Uncharacterized protein n=1 Tax=Cronartium quercuum f. sp. fusiforme G11 TaxID=708437 RepID=A0A9P6NPF3_9BASI|nr:hypothetical protein CROQUDRAFT_132626 [Cronartium quercuum f. sp. fusiforme G11]